MDRRRPAFILIATVGDADLIRHGNFVNFIRHESNRSVQHAAISAARMVRPRSGGKILRRLFGHTRHPFNLFGGTEYAQARPRKPKVLEAKALETLGLDEKATGADIKARYKELVKRHHPDANGGDRGSEDRFRDVIQAYRQAV